MYGSRRSTRAARNINQINKRSSIGSRTTRGARKSRRSNPRGGISGVGTGGIGRNSSSSGVTTHLDNQQHQHYYLATNHADSDAVDTGGGCHNNHHLHNHNNKNNQGGVRKYALVQRRPAPHIDVLVTKWVPVTELTDAEREAYDQNQRKHRQESSSLPSTLDVSDHENNICINNNNSVSHPFSQPENDQNNHYSTTQTKASIPQSTQLPSNTTFQDQISLDDNAAAVVAAATTNSTTTTTSATAMTTTVDTTSVEEISPPTAAAGSSSTVEFAKTEKTLLLPTAIIGSNTESGPSLQEIQSSTIAPPPLEVSATTSTTTTTDFFSTKRPSDDDVTAAIMDQSTDPVTVSATYIKDDAEATIMEPPTKKARLE
jgi:hypothetical protein